MIAKKKIVVIAVALMAMLTVGIATAALVLSNTLSTTFTVVSPATTGLNLTWLGSLPGSLSVGVWYQSFGFELKNPGSATFNNVYVNFTISCTGGIPENSLHLRYFDGSIWNDVVVSGWGTNAISGNFVGPITVAPGYDSGTTNNLAIMLEGNATTTSSYNYQISALQWP